LSRLKSGPEKNPNSHFMNNKQFQTEPISPGEKEQKGASHIKNRFIEIKIYYTNMIYSKIKISKCGRRATSSKEVSTKKSSLNQNSKEAFIRPVKPVLRSRIIFMQLRAKIMIRLRPWLLPYCISFYGIKFNLRSNILFLSYSV
jgi:hypothetical protein